jgi:hypothetical protein
MFCTGGTFLFYNHQLFKNSKTKIQKTNIFSKSRLINNFYLEQMSNIVQYAEEVIYDWIISLPDDDMKEIHDGSDIIAAINEEAEEEISLDYLQLLQ